jgi:hypothetical protein
LIDENPLATFASSIMFIVLSKSVFSYQALIFVLIHHSCSFDGQGKNRSLLLPS